MEEKELEVSARTETNEDLSQQVLKLQQELNQLRSKNSGIEDPTLLNKMVDELVEKRLRDREQILREQVEQAKEQLRKAQSNEILESHIQENERFSNLTTWRQNKEQEIIREMDFLCRLVDEDRISKRFYLDANPASGSFKQSNLDVVKLVYAIKNLGSKKVFERMKNNYLEFIGVIN